MVKTEPFNGMQDLANPFTRIGEQRGEQHMAREMLLRVLLRRFSSVPDEARHRVEQADVAWCQAMIEKAAVANSLADLGLA